MLTNKGPNYEDRENCGTTTFPEAFAKYNEMLNKIRDRTIPIKVRAKDKKRTPLLTKEEVEKLGQQFHNVKRLQQDKPETAQWKSIEQCHDTLVKLACTAADDQKQLNDTIDDLLKKLKALDWHRYSITPTLIGSFSRSMQTYRSKVETVIQNSKLLV